MKGSKANPAVIGAFVVAAAILAVVVVLIFGSRSMLTRTQRCVLFFEGSIAGLDIGAPVEFRGVRIGRVAKSRIIYNATSESYEIPVYVELDTDVAEGVIRPSGADPEEAIKGLVDRGLRGRLENMGLVTGKVKISLDFFPDTEPRLVRAEAFVPEIPTVPGALQALADAVENLPITEIAREALRAVSSTADLIDSDETRKLIASMNTAAGAVASVSGKVDSNILPVVDALREALASVQELAEAMSDEIEPVGESIRQAAAAAAESLEVASKALTGVEEAVQPDSPLRYETIALMQELSQAARAIRALADLVEREPNVLILGKPER